MDKIRRKVIRAAKEKQERMNQKNITKEAGRGQTGAAYLKKCLECRSVIP